jgi:hypothetical protein
MQLAHNPEADRIILQVFQRRTQRLPVIEDLFDVLKLLAFFQQSLFLLQHFVNGVLCTVDSGGQHRFLGRQR